MRPNNPFSGKNVWISGASSGIGEALAYALSKKGATLILSARNNTRLQDIAAKCINPDKHKITYLDLTDPPNIQETVSTIIADTGPIDILINSAGVSQRSLAKDTPLSIDRQIMEVNFFGTVALSKALLPPMLERKSGHIVTISSIVGKFGVGLRSTYCASKHAIHGFMDSLRAETSEDGIKVTLICPGFVRTRASINALLADGTPQGTMEETHARGMPVELCADKIIRAIEREKSEVYIGGKEVLGVYIKRYAPIILEKIVKMKTGNR